MMLTAIICQAQNPVMKDTAKTENKSAEVTQNKTDSKYKVGQMWSYKTRPQEKKSYFIIVKIDVHPKLGNIIHIAVHDLKIKNPNSRSGFSDEVNHMPFSEAAINKSADKLLKEKIDLPDYEEGYQLWKEAFDSHHAGIYTITLAEAVDAMEASLNQ
ncbi:MAG TPA: hypothetical protein VF721_24290 [Pyrinomonadaceae bacterium]|jgi:hypothetical protein